MKHNHRSRPAILPSILPSILLLGLVPGLKAQQPDPLADVITAHRKRVAQLERAEPYDPDAVDREYASFAGTLAKLATDAKDRRLRLRAAALRVETLMLQGKEQDAIAAMQTLRSQSKSHRELLQGAALAIRLRLKEQARQFVDAALGQELSDDERLEAAHALMTELQQPKRGQAIFDAALAAQTTDEGRARILWLQSLATRDREDLAEGAYVQALAELSRKLPKTRYGSIAADRLAAFDLSAGKPAIGFDLRDQDGKPHRLPDYAGKVLLLYFWDSQKPGHEVLHAHLQKLEQAHKKNGLLLLGINLDRDEKRFQAAVRAQKITWPQVFAGGADADIALRYKADLPPLLLLIGHDQKIAGANFVLRDATGYRELEQVTSRTLAAASAR